MRVRVRVCIIMDGPSSSLASYVRNIAYILLLSHDVCALQVSKSIAIEVAKLALSEGLSRLPTPPEDVAQYISKSQYDPSYAPLIVRRK